MFISKISYADSFGLGVLQAVIALFSCLFGFGCFLDCSFVVDVITEQESVEFLFLQVIGSDSNEVVYI